MRDKVLVTYASLYGSTAGVAEAIGAILGEDGTQVDVLPVTEVSDLSPYRAVVLGSAIRAGQWLSPAINFLKTHETALHQMPVAFFTVCITLHENTIENQQIVHAYLNPVRDILSPVTEGYFAGVVDPDTLNFFEKLIVRFVKAPIGDYRDWYAIRAWAGRLKPMLVAA